MGRVTDINIQQRQEFGDKCKNVGPTTSSSCTSVYSTDSRSTNIEKNLNAISNMFKKHQINATYDSNNPNIEPDFTRFCTYSKKSGQTMKICWSLKKKELIGEKAPA